MRQRELVGAVVRIWSSNAKGGADTIVGTGFLVSPRFIVTCAHVVTDALGFDDLLGADTPDPTVLLDFPAIRPGHRYQASIAVWRPRTQQPGGEYDIAGLVLTEDAPGWPARLSLLEDPWNRPCRVFGFPSGRPDGSYAEGMLKDVLANGWVMIRGGDDAREFVRRGYSGGPVYTADGVVGMLTEGDASGRVREAAMIPVSALLKAWPDLYTLNATCPYQGLASFDASSARFFFGREEATMRLVAAINEATQPTVLAGGSGSGKSSLVAAGVAPALRQAGWEICAFHPGGAPFSALAHALLRLWQPSLSGTALLLEQRRLADGLRNGELNLSSVVASILESRGAETKLVLSVDQFEELFTLNDVGDASVSGAAEDFLELLVSALNDQGTLRHVKLLLSVRTDFLDRLLASPQTASWHREEGFVHYLGAVAELERVMEGPLKASGLSRFEAGLVERIKSDLTYEEAALPLLEFTLTELWRRQEGGVLTHRAYDDLGGVGTALATYAQFIYEHLTSAEKEGMKRLFLQLMQPGSEGTVTRRAASLSELSPDLETVVSLLADKRLVVTGRSPEQPDAIEVVHEALFEYWPLLKGWVVEGWDFRRWQESLRAALKDWVAAGGAEDYLLQGARLTAAQEYADANPAFLTSEEIRYLRASRDFHERRQREAEMRLQLEARRQQRTSQILAAALVVTLLFSVVAAWQWNRAQQQTTKAEAVSGRLQESNSQLKSSTLAAQANARRALASTLGAQGLLATDTPSSTNGDPHLGALLAVQAFRVENSLSAMSNLMRVVERVPLPDSSGAPMIEPNPTGAQLLVSTSVNTELWDTVGLTKRTTLLEGTRPDAVAYSPDGKRLAAALPGTGIQLWDAEAGRALGAPFGPGDTYIVKLVFAPDGDHLLVASIEGDLELWDVKNRVLAGRVTRPVEVSPPAPDAAFLPFRAPIRATPSAEHLNWLASLAFDPQGRTLAVAGGEGEVRLYESRNLHPAGVIETAAAVRALAFSPDGGRLAVADRGGSVSVWRTADRKRIGTKLSGLTDLPQSLAFSASGRRLAAGDAGGNLLVWDLRSRTPYQASPSFGADVVYQLRFNGESLLVAGVEAARTALWRLTPIRGFLRLDRSLRAVYDENAASSLWRVDKDQLRTLLNGTPDSFLVQTVYSPTGTRFATRSSNRTAQLWDAATTTPVGEAILDQEDVESVAFTPDGKLFVTGDREGRVILRDGLSGASLRGPLPLGVPRALSIAFDPNGAKMAVATEGDVVVWDMRSGKRVGLTRWDLPAVARMELVQVVKYSPDGRWLLGGYGQYVYIWDADTLALERVLPPMAEDRKVRDLVFSPDGGELIATYNDAWTAVVWHTTGWEHKATLKNVSSASFSRGGELLALGGTLRVAFYDPDTLLALGDPIEVHEGSVTTVAFSPDGAELISSDQSNLNYRWDTTLRSRLAAACGRAGRNLSGAEWEKYLGDAPYKKTCGGYGVPGTAIDLLLKQASERVESHQNVGAVTLYRRAVTYAAESSSFEALRSACLAAAAYLPVEEPHCATQKTARTPD